MELLSTHWFLDLTGRFHPLLVHFPIGLLLGAFLLEAFARFQKKQISYAGMVYLGAISALVAAIMGQLLAQSGDYGGELLSQHQWLGWTTVILSLITTFLYWNRENLPKWLPLFMLGITCVSVSFGGHFGAAITHGEDYLKIDFNSNKNPVNSTIHIAKWTQTDSFSAQQLEELNLEVRAIFAHHCYQCHSEAKRKGGLALDSEEGVFNGGDSGAILIKGAPSESELIRRLKLPKNHEEVMPKKGKILPAESIELIELWINQGAVWADVGLKVFPEAAITLEQPNLPPIEDDFDHPIDRFVNQYFKAKNVQWQPLIDDRRFIRRAYLDITGLLPTAAEVDHFLQNQATDKRQQLIKALLADKENYTLHWMSFWNDLLRNDYSGPGFITKGRKQITNWLYESLQEEKPYNQMVAELVNPTKASAGFIEGIQWRGTVNASQRVELQAAQNISQSLLGLNLKCASCHNSFVNNLTLEQAYGFANIFADATLEIYRCDKPTGKFAKTSFIYPELGEVMADSLVDRLRQLADIITQPKNGRLYRTVVNRFWDKLFGRGIIAPVDEMDKPAWNQDLLDWLAADFIENGYSLPKLLETIMTSKTYQLPAVQYESPLYLTAENFEFRGPTPRRLTAEQFADAVSQTVQPLYHGVAYLPNDPPFPAQWIWYQDYELERRSIPKPGDRFLKKTFEIAKNKPIQSAEVIVTADNAFEFYFNEQKIGTGTDWRQVKKYQLAPTAFNTQNIIAIKGNNEGAIANPAGLLFALRVAFADGTNQYIYSDRSWVATNETPDGNWKSLNYATDEWEKVSSTSAQKSHWGKLPAFAYEKEQPKSDFTRAALVQLDPFLKTLGRPTRENVATSRDANATLLQTLMLSNSGFLHQNIQEGAANLLAKNQADVLLSVNQFYQHALGRLPTKEEQAIIKKQLNGSVKEEVVADLIWSVLGLPEFQFL